MTQRVGVAAAALALAFLAVALMKARSTPSDERARRVAVTNREAVVEFWELYRKATDHRLAERTGAAIEAYERALALNDAHEDALYYLGNMYRDAGRNADAGDAWTRLADINPQSARAHAELADLHFCFPDDPRFDLARAEVEVRRALEINKEETGPLLRLGQIALVKGEYQDAGAYFDQVIASNYTSIEAHFLKGYIAWKGRQADDALTFFGHAVRLGRPETPAGGVLGEGDTKTGSAPLLAGQPSCWGMEAVTGDLDRVMGTDLAREMNQLYRRLSTSLEQ